MAGDSSSSIILWCGSSMLCRAMIDLCELVDRMLEEVLSTLSGVPGLLLRLLRLMR